MREEPSSSIGQELEAAAVTEAENLAEHHRGTYRLRKEFYHISYKNIKFDGKPNFTKTSLHQTYPFSTMSSKDPNKVRAGALGGIQKAKNAKKDGSEFATSDYESSNEKRKMIGTVSSNPPAKRLKTTVLDEKTLDFVPTTDPPSYLPKPLAVSETSAFR